jgi:hypothetical protein
MGAKHVRKSRSHAHLPEQLSFEVPDCGPASLSPDLFPNNYAGNTAGTRIETDLHDAQDQLLITGFISLEKIIN